MMDLPTLQRLVHDLYAGSVGSQRHLELFEANCEDCLFWPLMLEALSASTSNPTRAYAVMAMRRRIMRTASVTRSVFNQIIELSPANTSPRHLMALKAVAMACMWPSLSVDERSLLLQDTRLLGALLEECPSLPTDKALVIQAWLKAKLTFDYCATDVALLASVLDADLLVPTQAQAELVLLENVKAGFADDSLFDLVEKLLDSMSYSTFIPFIRHFLVTAPFVDDDMQRPFLLLCMQWCAFIEADAIEKSDIMALVDAVCKTVPTVYDVEDVAFSPSFMYDLACLLQDRIHRIPHFWLCFGSVLSRIVVWRPEGGSEEQSRREGDMSVLQSTLALFASEGFLCQALSSGMRDVFPMARMLAPMLSSSIQVSDGTIAVILNHAELTREQKLKLLWAIPSVASTPKVLSIVSEASPSFDSLRLLHKLGHQPPLSLVQHAFAAVSPKRRQAMVEWLPKESPTDVVKWLVHSPWADRETLAIRYIEGFAVDRIEGSSDLLEIVIPMPMLFLHTIEKMTMAQVPSFRLPLHMWALETRGIQTEVVNDPAHLSALIPHGVDEEHVVEFLLSRLRHRAPQIGQLLRDLVMHGTAVGDVDLLLRFLAENNVVDAEVAAWMLHRPEVSCKAIYLHRLHQQDPSAVITLLRSARFPLPRTGLRLLGDFEALMKH